MVRYIRPKGNRSYLNKVGYAGGIPWSVLFLIVADIDLLSGARYNVQFSGVLYPACGLIMADIQVVRVMTQGGL